MNETATHFLGTFPDARSPVMFMVAGLAFAAVLMRAIQSMRNTPANTGLQKAIRSEVILTGRDAVNCLGDYNSLHTCVASKLTAKAPAALFMLRLDNLHSITAKDGHAAAENLITTTTERLRKLWPTERLCRLIGDDFGFVLGGMTTSSQIEAAALAILRAVEMPVQRIEGDLACFASIGIVPLTKHVSLSSSDVHDALLAAFVTLEKAFRAGGSRWKLFSSEERRDEVSRAALKEDLRAAIEANQITPYYQPIVDLSCGSIVGLEVLARWKHPTRGILPPELFIPLAEELQLSGRITHSLMRCVVADSHNWPKSVYFAFNASPGQLRELISLIHASVPSPGYALDPNRIEIEITESALIENLEVAKSVIEVLQAAGCRVVLDDFGVGFSNFYHLRELPFDKIKIDKSFIQDLCLDLRAVACVKTMIALGKSLNIEMVAEGVECAEVAERVVELGCDYGQGYLYSMPVSAEEVCRLLRQPVHRTHLRVDA